MMAIQLVSSKSSRNEEQMARAVSGVEMALISAIAWVRRATIQSDWRKGQEARLLHVDGG